MSIKNQLSAVQQSNIKEFILKAAANHFEKMADFEQFKKNFCRAKKINVFSNTDVRFQYLQLIKTKKIKKNTSLENFLITKKIRSTSGVTVVAVLTKPFPCPGKCIYCPEQKQMPKSYLDNEPAVMRAKAVAFDPYLQTQARLKMLSTNGHSIEKIELIVMGGTFSYLPKKYQNQFITECYRAANDFPAKIKKSKTTLENEKKRNETARQRIVALTLETRPDFINQKEIEQMRKLGATRIEIGVQHTDSKILKINRRGHGRQSIINATRLLKNAGFKISYHLMPGLWKSNPKKDLKMIQELFTNQAFQPDMIKIYPCVVTEFAPLKKIWQQGKYQPLTNRQNEKLITSIKKIIPPYVRISRLIRDIPKESILAGPDISNLRQKLAEKNISCRCIRCREIKGEFDKNEKIILDRIDYPASKGLEIFLQFVSTDKLKLFSLLRLRIPDKKTLVNCPIKTLRNSALIREVHTYGKVSPLGISDNRTPQHMGLGKKLIEKAEKIVQKEFGLKKIAVISGVGVRKYYQKLGYVLENEYMVKKLL